MRPTDMKCEGCKTEINSESAIGGRCARCAAKAPAQGAKADPSAKGKQEVEHGHTTESGQSAWKGSTMATTDRPAAPAKTEVDHSDDAEPAHLGHAHSHTKSEPDHGKSSKHK